MKRFIGLFFCTATLGYGMAYESPFVWTKIYNETDTPIELQYSEFSTQYQPTGTINSKQAVIAPQEYMRIMLAIKPHGPNMIRYKLLKKYDILPPDTYSAAPVYPKPYHTLIYRIKRENWVEIKTVSEYQCDSCDSGSDEASS